MLVFQACRRLERRVVRKNEIARNCDPGCHTTVVRSGECAEHMAYGIGRIVRADRPGHVSRDASFGSPGNVQSSMCLQDERRFTRHASRDEGP